MSVHQELLSTVAKLWVFELQEGFRVAVHIPDNDCGFSNYTQETFLDVWGYFTKQNVMFSNLYNMRGMI